MSCTIHQHSSERTAQRCWRRQLQRRADRWMKRAQPAKVTMRQNTPPRLVKRGEVWMLVFWEDARMRY